MRPHGHPLHMVDRVAATQRTLDRFKGKGHAFGSCDCIRIAAAHVRQFGYKPQLAKAGSYRSLNGAKAALARAGYATVADAVDALGLERIPPASAWVGDLIELPSEDGLAALTVALGNGRVLGFHPACGWCGRASAEAVRVGLAGAAAMSRTLAAAAEVVAVVVAVAAAIPTGGTSLLAATLGVTGTAASAIAAGVGLAASGLEMLANRPKPPTVNPTEWKADPQAGIPYVFGLHPMSAATSFTGPRRARTTNTRNLVTIISGGGPIDGFDQFFVDSSYRIVGSDGTVDIADRGKMWMHTQLGHAPEAAALPMSPGSPASWTAMSKLSGYAATVVTLQYDAKGSVTFTSVPQCGWTVRGVRIYDPRLDSTYPGGNGPQRANDESTWIWSQNPILHALTWLIGRRQNGKLVLGVGLSLSGVLMAQFVEAANIADANVWITGGLRLLDRRQVERVQADAPGRGRRADAPGRAGRMHHQHATG